MHTKLPGYLPFLTLPGRNLSFYLSSWPNWTNFGSFSNNNSVNNVALSWNFDHRQSSWLSNGYIKDFEKIKFLQILDIPKVYIFGPTLTPIYRLKKSEEENILQEIIYPSSYPNQSKSRPYFLSIFNGKIQLRFALFVSFSGTNGLGVKDQEVTA